MNEEIREESPDAATGEAIPDRWDRLFASVEAGVVAAGISYGWAAAATLLDGRSVWTTANLMGSLFHGLRNYSPAFGMNTLSGLALHLLLVMLLAVGMGQLISPRLPLATAAWIGVLGGSSWYYLLDGFFWYRLFPSFAAYAKRPSMFTAWVLAGICVGLYSIFVRTLRVSAKTVESV